MDNNKIYLIVLICVITVVGVWFSLASPGIEETEKNNSTESGQVKKEAPNQKLSEISLDLYNNSRSVKLSLSAENIEQFDKKSLLKLYPVKIKVYDLNQQNKDKKLLYTFQAERGSYLNKQNQLDLKGPVSIKKDKIQLLLEDLTWQGTENRLTGKKVKLSAPNYTLSGPRLRANPELDYFIFYGNEKKKASFSWEEKVDETN